MKKTKSTASILLVLAILILGVGYALATSTLKINGTLGATTDNDNFKVKFIAHRKQTATVASTTVPAVVSTNIENDLLASFTVKDFTCKNDKVVLEYDVKNESTDLNATVTTADLATFTNKEYFSVVSSFSADSTVTSTTINANSTATLYVTVTCIKTPVEDVADATTNGIVTLTATAVAAS